jgi:hypothetical protein
LKRFLLHLCLLVACCVLGVSPAFATLSGEVEWGYAHYNESSDDGDFSASHFTQRYSLMYSTSGQLAGGRGGFYDLGVGAEWAGFSTDLDGEELSNDSYKLLYNGRISIAPGGLPFRLNAYSYDSTRISFERSDGSFQLQSLGGTVDPYRLINPRLVTDLHNGQTVISGFQAMAGIRNGSYMGRYREVLSRWPRVFIDYRDIYRRDMESETPQKYHDRDLAFISLNKKDNWFHVRIKEHEDMLDSRNNSLKKQLLLGTIDYMLKRQWINLTNWIAISVDGSYTEEERNWEDFKSKLYELNFMTSMNRKGMSVNSLLNMQREQRGSWTLSSLDLPVYYSRSYDPDTSLRSLFQLWRERRVRDDVKLDDSYDAYYTRVMLETDKRGRVQLNPSIELETDSGYRGDARSVRATVEAYSNRLRREKLRWYGSASLARFEGTDSDDIETRLWETELEGGFDRQLRSNLSVGASEKLLYGTGSYGTAASRYMRARSTDSFVSNGIDTSAESVDLLRSESVLFLEHSTRRRLRNRVQLYFKYQDKEGEQLDNLELSHRLDYNSQKWRVRLEHLFSTGDDIENLMTYSSYVETGPDIPSFRDQFQQRGTVEYRPNRFWKSSLESDITWARGNGNGTNLLLHFEQELERTFYARNFTRRKRATLTQSLIYERFKDGVDRQAMIFGLAGSWYPTRYWRLGAQAHYYDYDFKADTLRLSLTTGLDFPLFKLDFSYEYGTIAQSNVVAHRYELNVRKTF